VPRLSINFEELLSRVHGDFVEKNKVFEPSVIIINYCIIINAYYNYIINAQLNYYTSNKCLLEECDKEGNMEVTGASGASCSTRRL